MAAKEYTMVHNWPQVVSKPTDPVYLTQLRRRGDRVRLDPKSEDARRLLAAGSIVPKGQEDEALKAELSGDVYGDDVPPAASDGAAQTSIAAPAPSDVDDDTTP